MSLICKQTSSNATQNHSRTWDTGSTEALDAIARVGEIEGIRMLSVPDIIPMKLGALARRGGKKDFWDIACLLDHYSLAEMLDFFKQKYQNDDIGYVVLSLTYFNDAEMQDGPVTFQKLTWEMVKDKINSAVLNYMKTQNV